MLKKRGNAVISFRGIGVFGNSVIFGGITKGFDDRRCV
jgi:hypothetical protein